MIIVGAIAIIAVAFLLGWIFGEIGLLLVSVLVFGVLFSIYMKVQTIMVDTRLIKEKLGITENKEVCREARFQYG